MTKKPSVASSSKTSPLRVCPAARSSSSRRHAFIFFCSPSLAKTRNTVIRAEVSYHFNFQIIKYYSYLSLGHLESLSLITVHL